MARSKAIIAGRKEHDLENWESGEAYERYVGRWSRQIAIEFIRWLAPARGLAWGDIGSGTGALTSVILKDYAPSSVNGIDSSEVFVSQARQWIADPRALFERGDASRLPWETAVCDATVSGLVLNFVRDPLTMIREMARVTRPGGTVATYVWDYGVGMQMMRYFWDVAKEVSPKDSRLDQAERFPLCQPGPLQDLFEKIELKSVKVRPIDIPTNFSTFDDYWNPFLGGTGAAPSYLAKISEEVRERIRLSLQARLPVRPDGQIQLTARAWAAQGIAGG